MSVFILSLLFQLQAPVQEKGTGPIMVIDVDGTQAQIHGLTYYAFEDPRRVLIKFDDIFKNGFEELEVQNEVEE